MAWTDDRKVIGEHARDLGLEGDILPRARRQPCWIVSLRDALMVPGLIFPSGSFNADTSSIERNANLQPSRPGDGVECTVARIRVRLKASAMHGSMAASPRKPRGRCDLSGRLRG